jgi:AhpC/TSA family protein
LPIVGIKAARGRDRRALERAMAQPNRPVWRLKVGEEAPDFELTATGEAAGKGGPRKKVRLSDYRGKRNVVLAFYPAAFTPV